jgi:hypothetical protein
MTVREEFIEEYRCRDFTSKKKDNLYKKEFNTNLKRLLKEEIGQYLNWQLSEALKELENDSLSKPLKGSYYNIEKSIDKYLEK